MSVFHLPGAVTVAAVLRIDCYSIWVMYVECRPVLRCCFGMPEELDPMNSLFETTLLVMVMMVVYQLCIFVVVVAIFARVFAARRLWSCCCCCGHGTDCWIVSAAAAVGRALPHRVKRSQPDVGDVAVIVVVVVVADCGPVAGARSPPVYIVNI